MSGAHWIFAAALLALVGCVTPDTGGAAGDADWVRALERDVLPALEDFRPQFVLVSAGFDAHRLDPLAQTELTELGYRELTRRMLELADEHAGGRLVSVLEGGYSLEGLARSAAAHLGVLTGGDR